jgi:hypothetical protein
LAKTLLLIANSLSSGKKDSLSRDINADETPFKFSSLLIFRAAIPAPPECEVER